MAIIILKGLTSSEKNGYILTAGWRTVNHYKLGDAERSPTGHKAQDDGQGQFDGFHFGFGDAILVAVGTAQGHLLTTLRR
jgi:hypothetical protein